ncbi:hypothetical protein NC653_040611 [Populus alba x Populus x berolinensis]|uniref:Uncharacterized protein n=1 Tax=Populus alba x Populus x berolinensis TaxID=444605 RepID=A0AAD6PPU4_9ROSI|nr:hypothetical protein NC653_040611 [Populus alba x Populus x berolinensis]
MDKKVFSRVEALKKVGKEDWDFSKDPCSGEGNWSVLDLSKGFEGFFTAYTDFKPPQSSGNRNVVAIVTGTAAGAVFVALLVLGAMQRNGWLGGKVSADKGLCFARERKAFGVGRSRIGVRLFFRGGYGDAKYRSLMHQCKFL